MSYAAVWRHGRRSSLIGELALLLGSSTGSFRQDPASKPMGMAARVAFPLA